MGGIAFSFLVLLVYTGWCGRCFPSGFWSSGS